MVLGLFVPDAWVSSTACMDLRLTHPQPLPSGGGVGEVLGAVFGYLMQLLVQENLCNLLSISSSAGSATFFLFTA